jgi:hypothetical protein
VEDGHRTFRNNELGFPKDALLQLRSTTGRTKGTKIGLCCTDGWYFESSDDMGRLPRFKIVTLLLERGELLVMVAAYGLVYDLQSDLASDVADGQKNESGQLVDEMWRFVLNGWQLRLPWMRKVETRCFFYSTRN